MNNANDKDNLNDFDIFDDLKDFENYDLVDDTDDLLALINQQNEDYDSNKEKKEDDLTSNHVEDDVLKSLDFLLDEMEQTNSNNEDDVTKGDKSESDQGTGSDQVGKNDDDDELFNILDKMLQEEDEAEKDSSKAEDDGYLNIFDEEFNTIDENYLKDDYENLDENSVNSLDNKDSFDDSFKELFNEDQTDMNSNEDIFSIDDLMMQDEEIENNGFAPNDISNVFSDVLSAVSSLEDPIEDDLSLLIPDVSEVKDQKKKKLLNEIKEKPNKEKKKGLLSKVFSNIKDETEDEYKTRIQAETEEAEKKSKEKQEKALEKKEAKKIKSAEGKEVKKKKKIELAAAKKEAKLLKSKAKAEKKAKEAETAIYEYQGKINKIGASIVMLFFTVLVVVIIVGTNIFSYNVRISHATQYYERQKYTMAYSELTGLKLKENEKDLYKKVQTIMYVHKEINSYNNFNAMKMYPEALDSLLKGLVKYEEYIGLAEKIGVEKNFNAMKKDIVNTLDAEFRISETEADQINEIEDKEEYGQNVYDIASLKAADNKVSSNK